MSAPRIIPCLDVAQGRVVKGVRFQNLRDAGDPASAAEQYYAAGADEIVLLDIQATREARAATATVVSAVRQRLPIPLTVGGGVRELSDAHRLLDAGADKVALNSAAVATPDLINRLSERFGRSTVVVAIDAEATEAGYRVRVQGGTQRVEVDAVAFAADAERRGAGEILLTSFDRDGTRSGYDLQLLAAVSQEITIPLIASGGASTTAHFVEALRLGCDGLLAASIFHDQDTTPRDLKIALRNEGFELRPC